MSSLAQTDVILKGQIQNDLSDKDFISVINLSLNKGTITASDGSFEIQAQENDIIDISALQYKNSKLIVTKEMIKRGLLLVKLEEDTIILPEITISNSDLSGNLNEDVGTIKTDKLQGVNYLSNTRRVPTPSERRLYTATTRGENMVEDRTDLRFDIPLTAVFNAVSGRTKKIKTLIDKQRALEQVVALENKFAPHFFTDALEIEISKIEDFLFYAQAVDETIYNHQDHNDLELVEALVKEAVAYKALSKQSIIEKE